MPSGKCKQNKKKRATIDLETKLKIIKKYEGGQRLSSLASDFGFAPSTVSTILKDAARIKQHAKGSSSLKTTIITKQREGPITEMEKKMTIWIEDLIQKRVPLSLMMIQEKAKSLFLDLKGKYPQDTHTFAASNGWFARFKIRAGFHNVQVSGEAASGDIEASKKYPEWLKNVIDEGQYAPNQIFNVDETGLFYQKMPTRTYISIEDKFMSGNKMSKNRVTLLLGGNASGSCKIKPFLIHNSANPRALKGVEKSLLPVHYRSNTKSWMTKGLFEDWFKNCFIPEVKSFCDKNSIPFKILLVLDNAPSHPNNLDDINSNVKVVFLPPNTTALLQPMDLGVIANFKAYYLRSTLAKAIAAIDANPDLTLRAFWKSYNIYDAIKNIAKAWENVTSTCLKHTWKKVCPHFNYNLQSEKDETFEDLSKSIVTLANQLELEVDENDVQELVESDAKPLSNSDLNELEAVNFEGNCDTSEMEVEDAKKFVKNEMSLAFRELDSFLCRFENMDPDTSRYMRVKRIIEDSVACYKQIYEEKKKAAVQVSLDRFLQKMDQPSTSTGLTCVSNERATHKQSQSQESDDDDDL